MMVRMLETPERIPLRVAVTISKMARSRLVPKFWPKAVVVLGAVIPNTIARPINSGMPTR